MLQMTLKNAAQILGIENESLESFTGISIDTRTLLPGNLFVAIVSPKRDGHDFVAQAFAKGAKAALISKPLMNSHRALKVNDTVAALGTLAKNWREQFDIPFIAITGSNGKTTVKNLTKNILLEHCLGIIEEVLASEGSFNNHLGVPLTLAQLTPKHRYAIIEMGMNHLGEIDYLTQLTRPHIALITNAGPSHLEALGSLENIAKAKGEIFNGLQADGIAILNRDDAFFEYWQNTLSDKKIVSFGLHPEADYRGIINNEDYSLMTPAGCINFKLGLLGKHNLMNALAASAIAANLNVSLRHIKKGLEKTQPAFGRLQQIALPTGAKIINDAYNANPNSLKAALDTLVSLPGDKMLVLGDMMELGKEENKWHALAGTNIKNAGIKHLITYGKLSEKTAQAFGEGAHHFVSKEALLHALIPYLKEPLTILVKGSHAMGLDEIVKKIIKKHENVVL